MKPATLFVATYLIWLSAKGRLGSYWKLATTDHAPSAAPVSSSGGTSAAPAASSSPGGAAGDMFTRMFGNYGQIINPGKDILN